VRPSTRRRFFAKLVLVGKCLEFTGTRNKAGYGFVDLMVRGKRFPILAHRLAWAIAHDCEIPSDRIICHRCDNPSCCNPKHLYLGTPATNAADKVRAGRQVSTLRGVLGEAHPASKYSNSQRAEAVGGRKVGESYQSISAAIGVPADTVGAWWRAHVARSLP